MLWLLKERSIEGYLGKEVYKSECVGKENRRKFKKGKSS